MTPTTKRKKKKGVGGKAERNGKKKKMATTRSSKAEMAENDACQLEHKYGTWWKGGEGGARWQGRGRAVRASCGLPPRKVSHQAPCPSGQPFKISK